VWQSNTKYRRVIWRCNDRYNKNGNRDCNTSHFREDDVKSAFITAFNKLMENRDGLIDDCREAQRLLCDISSIEAEIVKLEQEVEVVEGLARQARQSNAREVINQSEWTERNGVYLNRHAEATKRLEELDTLKAHRLGRSKTIALFIRNLERNKDITTEFDESLWLAVVEYVVVGIHVRSDKKTTCAYNTSCFHKT
jgi:hypothetical protein